MLKKLFSRLRQKKKAGVTLESPRMTTSRRYRCFAIEPSIMVGMFTQGSMFGVSKGILPGSRFLGAQMDTRDNFLRLFVEHPMYTRVPDGGEVPLEMLELTDLRNHFNKEIDMEQHGVR